MYKIIKTSHKSLARLGKLKTSHGTIDTPFFMPVATQGTVKQLSANEMKGLGAQILLSNTYHLMLRPGETAIKKMGGLHKFMDWNGPILTDSGGFQVFSLAEAHTQSGKSLVKLNDNGVIFKSYIDGKKHDLTPERSFDIQSMLGVDIAVCLDECVALPAERSYVEESVELTSRWAKRTREYWRKKRGKKPLLFAVVQGGLEKDLRLKSVDDLKQIGFDGYNIGGLSVGETSKDMYCVLDYLVPEMPCDKPRYLMGVGYPDNIVESVKRGVDMFDCVIPTREGRHGRLFVRNKRIKIGSDGFYSTFNINNAEFSSDKKVINSESKINELRSLSRAYLHYLFKIKEPLAQRLASLNNLEFYLNLLADIRKNIFSNML